MNYLYTIDSMEGSDDLFKAVDRNEALETYSELSFSKSIDGLRCCEIDPS